MSDGMKASVSRISRTHINTSEVSEDTALEEVEIDVPVDKLGQPTPPPRKVKPSGSEEAGELVPSSFGHVLDLRREDPQDVSEASLSESYSLNTISASRSMSFNLGVARPITGMNGIEPKPEEKRGVLGIVLPVALVIALLLIAVLGTYVVTTSSHGSAGGAVSEESRSGQSVTPVDVSRAATASHADDSSDDDEAVSNQSESRAGTKQSSSSSVTSTEQNDEREEQVSESSSPSRSSAVSYRRSSPSRSSSRSREESEVQSDTQHSVETSPSASEERALDTSSGESGYLTLVTVPWSNVTLNGRSLGTTPLMRQRLPAGQHVLTLHNPELGITTTYPITIRAGSIVTRRIGLQ